MKLALHDLYPAPAATGENTIGRDLLVTTVDAEQVNEYPY